MSNPWPAGLAGSAGGDVETGPGASAGLGCASPLSFCRRFAGFDRRRRCRCCGIAGCTNGSGCGACLLMMTSMGGGGGGVFGLGISVSRRACRLTATAQAAMSLVGRRMRNNIDNDYHFQYMQLRRLCRCGGTSRAPAWCPPGARLVPAWYLPGRPQAQTLDACLCYDANMLCFSWLEATNEGALVELTDRDIGKLAGVFAAFTEETGEAVDLDAEVAVSPAHAGVLVSCLSSSEQVLLEVFTGGRMRRLMDVLQQSHERQRWLVRKPQAAAGVDDARDKR